MPDCSDSIESFALLTVSATRQALVSNDCQALTGSFRAPAAGDAINQHISLRCRQLRAQFSIPRLSRRWHLSPRGRSKRVSAMTRKAITLRIVVSSVSAAATTISISAVYYKPIYQAEADHTVARNSRSAEFPDLSGRLSRVHLLLSSMK
jgi:hypothetical protein